MKKKNKIKDPMLKMAVGNLIAIPLIGASAGMVNSLPAGTAKSVAGIVPGLQSVALVSENMKMFPKDKKKGKKKGKNPYY